MTSNSTKTAIQIPSGFAMPAWGHAFDAITGLNALSCAPTTGTVVRDRQVVVGLGYAENSFPGITAWRPPIS